MLLGIISGYQNKGMIPSKQCQKRHKTLHITNVNRSLLEESVTWNFVIMGFPALLQNRDANACTGARRCRSGWSRAIHTMQEGAKSRILSMGVNFKTQTSSSVLLCKLFGDVFILHWSNIVLRFRSARFLLVS